jgi:hypothetical protein
MDDWQKNLNEKLTEYLYSKYSENTRKYVSTIIEFLNKPDEDGLPISVKAKDMQEALVPDKIPYIGIYYRLLKELGEEGIGIIKKEIGEKEPRKRGKNPIFYRLVALHKMPSYNEISASQSRCHASLFIVMGRLSAAYELLKESKIKNPDKAVNERYSLITKDYPDLSPFAYSDEQLKGKSLGTLGISRIYENITFIPPFRNPYGPNEKPPYGDDY